MSKKYCEFRLSWFCVGYVVVGDDIFCKCYVLLGDDFLFENCVCWLFGWFFELIFCFEIWLSVCIVCNINDCVVDSCSCVCKWFVFWDLFFLGG